MNEFSTLRLLVALGFFLYGLRQTETNVRRVAGPTLRSRLDRLTRHRPVAFVVGLVTAILFQSATAVIVLLVGLTGGGVIRLAKAAAVVLGADVGTSVLVLLLALILKANAPDVGRVVLLVGFLSVFVFRQGRKGFYAEALLGFGLVFFGLSQLMASAVPLKNSDLFRQVVEAVAAYPFFAILLGALLTVLVQSSAAILGTVLSLTAAGLIQPPDALWFVLGANLGSTGGPIMAGLRTQTEGRKLAGMHFFFKVVGVGLAIPLAQPLLAASSAVFDSPTFQVAGLHILLNVGIAAIFLPFVAPASEWIGRAVPASEDTVRFRPKYLDEGALSSPTWAFANVFREILRIAEIVQGMCAMALKPFEEIGGKTEKKLIAMDDQVDTLTREIKFYLAKIVQGSLTEEQSKREVELLMLATDLEAIGDVITKELLALSQKKQRKQVSFSAEGWNEINDFHAKVLENFRLAVTSFATGDVSLGEKVLRHKKVLAQIEQGLGQKHLLRLSEGLRESYDTSSLHLDMLGNLRRINSIVSKLVYPVLSRKSGDTRLVRIREFGTSRVSPEGRLDFAGAAG